MSRIASLLFPPAVASALMAGLFFVLTLGTAVVADTPVISQGPCDETACQGSSSCNSYDNVCTRPDCSEDCAFSDAVGGDPGEEVCSCVYEITGGDPNDQ